MTRASALLLASAALLSTASVHADDTLAVCPQGSTCVPKADLDTFVKALANNPANKDQNEAWFLTEAHKRVNALHGAVTPPVPPPPAVKGQNRTPPAVPKSIAGIPGGEGPGDVGSEFAAVDALTGQAREDAIARMTPAQREK